MGHRGHAIGAIPSFIPPFLRSLGSGLYRVATPWLIIGGTLGEPGLVPIAAQPISVDGNLIKLCVNQLLYDHTFRDGTPAGDRTIIDPRSAAVACRGIRSRTQAESIQRCMNQLLYDRIFTDGKPAGDRTILDPSAAAEACQLCPALD
ncbi:hypothetical protein [Lyngbya confervoides]|uniref:Uncharacterized protein n=1 Tax=Lyngbya confervoides BDU141951 TaxID=1574623 RepID=A0ABD4T9A0_9CYAN|nr:hypothetical protein [Lyngbya confervoides]MCM1985024.1 hypothetical protein [Lyngbya confervoides BDU141951]